MGSSSAGFLGMRLYVNSFSTDWLEMGLYVGSFSAIVWKSDFFV